MSFRTGERRDGSKYRYPIKYGYVEDPMYFSQLHVSRIGATSILDIPPVENTNYKWKPRGGFWTSTFIPEGEFPSEWVEYAYYVGGWGADAFLLTVNSNARIYTIDSLADLIELINKYSREVPDYTYRGGYWNTHHVDWEKVSQDYDGVHLTSKGRGETRYTEPDIGDVWDSESTLWFRNVFTSITPYEGKLPKLKKKADEDEPSMDWKDKNIRVR